MRTSIVFLLVAVALAAAVFQEKVQINYATGNQLFVERQKDVLMLFKYIQQPSFYQPFTSVPYDYPIQNEQFYVKPEIVKEFFNLYKHGFLPKGEVFSIYYPQHKMQAMSLYKLFYYAKDFDTFFKTAVWARQHINEQMFVYIFSVAMAHRPDTQEFTLPPIYKVFPQFFFSNEVIQQAQMYKQMMSGHSYTQAPVITANYSGYYLYLNKEQSMSYFTEDIGFTAFYYYYNVYYPFWLDESESSFNKLYQRSTYYPVIYQQLLARYYLERLSNGLGHVPFLDIDNSVIETGFYSSLKYPNGLEFPVRPDGAQLMGPIYVNPTPYNFNYTMSYKIFKNYDRRISDAIDLGYVFTRSGEKVPITGASGLNILADIIQGTPNSMNPRYYGNLAGYAKYIYGYSYVPYEGYKAVPSVLEQTTTAMRDPMFYQIYKWINFHIQRYVSYLPYYTYQDLLMPGIKIQSFEIDRLITYFDYYYVDISNALYVSESEFNQDNAMVKVRQQRLNHKPFQYKANVQSTQVQDVEVKVFLGPKYDELHNELDMYENYWNFVLFDSFEYKLQAGQNVIVRNSGQSPYYVPDEMTYKDMYTSMYKGFQQGNMYYNHYNMSTRLPKRLMLPKGAPNGKMYQMYLFIGPVQSGQTGQSTPLSQVLQPKLYPFDKFVEMDAYEVPNAFMKDVPIYLQEFSEMGSYTL